MPRSPVPVLVAGIGGASLGTEILKCLSGSARYAVHGCDVSPLAFGHYQGGVCGTYVVDRARYVDSVTEVCLRIGARAVVPGGEEPMVLLGAAADRFRAEGIHIAANSPPVISVCSDKARLFAKLAELGIPIPRTVVARDRRDLEVVPCPCVVKPSTGSGGSALVRLAPDRAEAVHYAEYLLRNGRTPVVQEYLPVEDGEFTVGVLSLPDGRMVGSIALERLFHAKLSVGSRTSAGLISSGYSQGLVRDFPEVRAQAERIASALGSKGPLNVQGRVRAGTFLPFEINPRFSASTWLRAMAGFNEIEMYLDAVLLGIQPRPPKIRPGYYLRSLSEVYVAEAEVKG